MDSLDISGDQAPCLCVDMVGSESGGLRGLAMFGRTWIESELTPASTTGSGLTTGKGQPCQAIFILGEKTASKIPLSNCPK